MTAQGRMYRLGIVILFLLVCTGIFLYFLQGTATRIPGIEDEGYEATIKIRNIDNLVPATKIRIAGVEVGEVRGVRDAPDGAVVTFALLQSGAVPLHQGVKVRVGEKSLIGDTFLEVIDGKGAPLPSGSTLPDDAAVLSTKLDDVIKDLDPPTRAALGRTLRSSGEATRGTQPQIDTLAGGLGDLGTYGQTALDALASQSAELRQLGKNTQSLTSALNTNQGAIASLVSNADTLTKATAGQQQALGDTVRQLPGVLDTANSATGKVTDLSRSLAPVASGLKTSSRDLNSALTKLPSTTADLRGLLPALDGTLDRAPETLDKVSPVAEDISALAPPTVDILRDVNPVLKYLQPYGKDLSNFFTNFNAVLAPTNELGLNYARLRPGFNEASVPGLKSSALATYYNPIPGPGLGSQPGPFKGAYPRVERDPN